ncbi:MAG TPA: hypothetical protein PKB06_06175, partial [Actinotalea sp.]|nr:hypothetical protein [Actinotalea sp.]
RAEISVWLASPRLRLPGDQVRHTSLLAADTAAEHATLVAGRWPRVADGVTEVAVPTIVASALGVGPGDRLELGATDGVDPAATVGVGGLVDLASSPTWARDPLGGEGVDDGDRVPVLGPLLTVPGALSTTDATVGRLAVEVDVDPTGRPDAIADLAARVGGLSRAAQAQLGDGSVDYLTARSGLGRFAADARTELARTAGLVLAVVLLVLVLAGAALALVVRATAGARATEVALLGDRGAGRVRLAAWAAVENLGLGALAAALAVPLAAAGYRGLTAVAP